MEGYEQGNSFSVLQAAGSPQLCAGQDSVIHAVRELLNRPETKAILLINVSNALSDCDLNFVVFLLLFFF